MHNLQIDKYVHLRGLMYIHTCRSYVHKLCKLDMHVSHKSLEASHYTKGVLRPILGFWGSKVPQNGRFLPRTLVNHRAKFDAASFILGKEILNRTNTKLQRNSNRYIRLAYRHVWIKRLTYAGLIKFYHENDSSSHIYMCMKALR